MPSEPKASILLVDDERANLLALEVVLEPLGQEVICAHSGEEAIEVAEHRDFAVILLDVRMSGLNGFETAERIRSNPKSARTPIIFLTAYESNHESVQQAYYRLKAVDYLVKPLIPEIVRSKVAVFVDLHQKTESLRLAEQQQRMRAERAVYEGEEQFRQLADSIPHLAWMARPDGYVYWYNQRWYEYTGTTLEDVEGWGWKSVHDLTALPRVFAKFRSALDKGQPWEDTVALRRRDGVMRWHLSRALPVRDEQGRVVRWLGTHTDVTDQREAAQRKDEFLAMLAHELRNPLAPLTNGLKILRTSNLPQAAQQQTHQMMERQLRHLARVVEDLMDASRISQGKVQLRRERVDLARLVRTVVDDHRITVERSGLTVQVETPTTPLWISADPTRLTQVVNNLLMNAVKFSDAGGKIHVQVRADDIEGKASLRVRDEGIGIEPEMLPRLFEAFTQGNRALDRTRGGIGLGLALVWGLVQLHGGTVSAFSEGPGRGAEFAVTLPRLNEPAALTEAALPPRKAGKRNRILIVEDNRDAADSLRLLLSMLGHEVKVSYTGREGLEAARDWAPEVVVCDIGLPELDGYDVARELRRNPSTAHSRLLALTGYGQPEDRRRSEEAGFDFHLVKPADPEQIQELLAT